MRPQAGVGKLKHAPPLQANDLPLVAQAVPPAAQIGAGRYASRRADQAGLASCRVTYRETTAESSMAAASANSASVMLCVASRMAPTACGLA